MVYIKEYRVERENPLILVDDYSRLMQRRYVVIGDQPTLLVKRDGFLLIGETKEDVIKEEENLKEIFRDKLNPADIELNIPW